MIGYRVGAYHRVTVIAFDASEPSDVDDRRESDHLMATAQTPEYAERIVEALLLLADQR